MEIDKPKTQDAQDTEGGAYRPVVSAAVLKELGVPQLEFESFVDKEIAKLDGLPGPVKTIEAKGQKAVLTGDKRSKNGKKALAEVGNDEGHEGQNSGSGAAEGPPEKEKKTGVDRHGEPISSRR